MGFDVVRGFAFRFRRGRLWEMRAEVWALSSILGWTLNPTLLRNSFLGLLYGILNINQ